MERTVNRKPRHWQAFIYALGIALIIFLPFIIYDKGYFIYYGDFNVQQIPFYKLAHEAVRSGDLFWNWYTDLGANFVGSYSFYLLFSPFFWLTLPFPTEWLPFLMAPLLVLKTACASLTAYCYLERFLKNTAYAVIGGLLYAFSGWMTFNIFFNHFHEVAVFFPLLLLGVEELIQDGRRGFFAFTVLINAIVNYWFFTGEAVFVLLYVLVRMTDRTWGMTLKKFLSVAMEAVLGVGCAAFVLLPSVLALMGNPRTGTDELLNGWNFWLYWHEQRYPAVIHSLFLPPELPARPNFFPDHGAKWASLSGWLPMISMSGVLAYFFKRKNDWIKKLLALCLVFALVPGLNSLFILLNNSYYARWFYMPVLLMALASMRAVEDSGEDIEPFRRSLKWTTIVVFLFVIISGVTPNLKDGEWQFGMAAYPTQLWIYAAVAMVGLVLTTVLVMYLRHSRRFQALLGAGIALVSICFSIFFMATGKNNYERSQFIVNSAIRGREMISLPEEPFARSDIFDGLDNMLMYWHLPNIQAFHSIVPVSIMEFYPEVGVKRDVGSRPESKYYALRPLLSVRWLFIQSDKDNQEPMPGYVKYGEQVGFNIYENQNFLPMGFAYEDFLTRDQLEEIEKDLRSNVLLRAVVLEKEGIARNDDLLWQLDTDETLILDVEAMEKDVRDRRRYTADTFAFDNRGFTATTSFDEEQFLFFSVPYEKGWSAVVNGQEAVIEVANIGFMAVRVPAGSCEIRFRYMTPGLLVGLAISGCCILILASYWMVSHKRRRARTPGASPSISAAAQTQQAVLSGETVQLTSGQYREQFHPEERASKLQRVLNEAEERHIEERLPPQEQTLRFVLPDERPEQAVEHQRERQTEVLPEQGGENNRQHGGQDKL